MVEGRLVFLEEVLWCFFKSTGQIGAYLFYKEFHEIQGQQIGYDGGNQPPCTPGGLQGSRDIEPMYPGRGGPGRG